MRRRKVLRILRGMGPEGPCYFAAGTVVAGFLTATIIGAPFGAVVLAITVVVAGVMAASVAAPIAPLVL